ncbi:MAG TPA: hypothetical protein VFO37_00110, partial [Chitinophagaceae bacterium]|nr:hypothetical protein [Chitinophagaceae bacterium]
SKGLIALNFPLSFGFAKSVPIRFVQGSHLKRGSMLTEFNTPTDNFSLCCKIKRAPLELC